MIEAENEERGYEILVRQTLLSDLAHLEPDGVGPIASLYMLDRRLTSIGAPGDELLYWIDGLLRLTRAKLGLRSEQLKESMIGRGNQRNREDDERIKVQGEQKGW